MERLDLDNCIRSQVDVDMAAGYVVSIADTKDTLGPENQRRISRIFREVFQKQVGFVLKQRDFPSLCLFIFIYFAFLNKLFPYMP